MANSAASAFGQYLHSLRDRRGLILQEVEDRALAAGHRIDKGTVSRFERGRQRLPLPALLPLARIYAVPFEALLERLELDHDAEQLELPQNGATLYEQLYRMAREALFRRSRKLEAYAYFRDAQDALRAGKARSTDENGGRAIASLNLATVARSLGKNRYALHELSELQATSALDAGLEGIVLDRLANCYRCLGHGDRAERSLEQAVTAADSAGDSGVLSYAYYSWGALEHDRGDWDRCLELLDFSHRAHRDATDSIGAARPNPTFEVEVLLKMADAQLRRGAADSSGRLALAARRLAVKRGYDSGLGYAELQLGEVQDRVGCAERALEHWTRAVELSRKISNRRLEFQAELYRYQHMMKAGNCTLARASRRSLERLELACPDHLEPVLRFRELTSGNGRRGPEAPLSPSKKRSTDNLDGDLS